MSVTLRNVSPLGDLEVTGVGLVESGHTFTVDDDAAEGLVHQAEHFELVKPRKSASTTTTTTES